MYDAKYTEAERNAIQAAIAKFNQQWMMRFSNNGNDFDGSRQDYIGSRWLVQGSGSSALRDAERHGYGYDRERPVPSAV